MLGSLIDLVDLDVWSSIPRRPSSLRRTADRGVAETMERKWKNEGATGRKPFKRFKP